MNYNISQPLSAIKQKYNKNNSLAEKERITMEALTNFLAFIDKDLLVGHNIHTFDANFIYDSGMLMLRKGKFGEFWGCMSFPLCRYIRNK